MKQYGEKEPEMVSLGCKSGYFTQEIKGVELG